MPVIADFDLATLTPEDVIRITLTDAGIQWPDDVPDELVMMRDVYLGRPQEEGLGLSFKQWMDAKPVAFSERLVGLVTSYWDGKRESVVGDKSWDGKGCCPTCRRGLEAGEQVEPELGNLIGGLLVKDGG